MYICGYTHNFIYSYTTHDAKQHTTLLFQKYNKCVNIYIYMCTYSYIRIFVYSCTVHDTKWHTISSFQKQNKYVNIHICEYIHIFVSSYIHSQYMTRNGTLSGRDTACKTHESVTTCIFVNTFIHSYLQ